jgi:HPt (histidine-containing phosphotransfer) domain-containing protein
MIHNAEESLPADSIDFELDELVATTLDLMRVRADDKGLDVVCELSQDIHRALRGDPNRLRQVLINLLGNAVKFTEAGQVCLRIEGETDLRAAGFQTLRFSVSDTGTGIPPAKQSPISETFTCRQIIERMGGRLEVTGIPGKGSTFSFAVPFKIAARRAAHPDSAVQMPVMALSAHAMDGAFGKSRELAPWYFEKRRTDLVALVVALQAGDYDAIRIRGHDMKGSGAGYGLDAIAKIGAALEAAAKKESDGPIGMQISALGDYLERVEVV